MPNKFCTDSKEEEKGKRINKVSSLQWKGRRLFAEGCSLIAGDVNYEKQYQKIYKKIQII